MERNEPCWCGSGQKYKKCHMAMDDKIKLHALKGEIVPHYDFIALDEFHYVLSDSIFNIYTDLTYPHLKSSSLVLFIVLMLYL